MTNPLHGLERPSAWVARFAGLVAPGATVLDLACGAGRHSRLFSERGHPVVAVDRDPSALAQLADLTNLRAMQADLEGGDWPLSGQRFGAVVVTNYLHRPLLPLLAQALERSGVILYETFMAGNERYGRPSNPLFLLRPDELLEWAREARLTVVAFEQGKVELPKPAVVQRLCALAGVAASEAVLSSG